MHIDDDSIERMTFVELDEIRHLFRLTKKDLCRQAGLCQSTYTRWLRHVRGLKNGSAPHPRSMSAVRQVLKRTLASRRRPGAAPPSSVAA